MMLKAYIDDSNIGQGKSAVLGGWIAPAKLWAPFSNCWKAILEMKPRVQYFKWSEAWNLQGEFSGFSDTSRDEKVKFLMASVARSAPLGIVSVIPHDLYKEVFGGNRDKVIRNPYFFLFYGIVTTLALHLAKVGTREKVDFIFDVQMGQEEPVLAAWRYLLEVAPPEALVILENPPKFLHSRNLMPLQAADLCAGWTREQADSILNNQEPRAVPWGTTGDNLQCVGRYWSRDSLEELRQAWMTR